MFFSPESSRGGGEGGGGGAEGRAGGEGGVRWRGVTRGENQLNSKGFPYDSD